MLPRDPVMLLSYVNTQLRDRDASLDALCDREETDRDALCAACARSAMSMTLHRIALCDAGLCEV